MSPDKQSRRTFLNTSGSLIGGSWIALNLPAILATADFACRARRDGADFEVLTPAEATELEAIAAQIIPSDDTPGAREAGVIYFIDHALGTFMSDDLDQVREGLNTLASSVRDTHPEAASFAALAHDQQIETLQAMEESDFFETVRSFTIAGMFAHPSYGGNRDKIGWQLLHFDDRHVWEPPFGHYDEHQGDRG
ncbi:MAG: gluconate 2-dehydrogenase subunit 3 family protein [Rhodothermales bacterium]